MTLELLFYSLVGGLFSLIGGFLILLNKNLATKNMAPLLSFAAGAFLSAAFLDILPEAVEMVEESHSIFIFTLIGFLIYFILERTLMRFFLHHHTHEGMHSDHTESLTLLLILGDSFHNFLDGVVIALAYVANPTLGLISTLAIAAHEIPQEIGDFSVLLNQGWKKSNIILVNVLQSLLTIPGVLLGLYAGNILEQNLPYLLSIAAGVFIYIAASDLIPEVHHKAGHRGFLNVIVPLALGIIAVWYLIGLAHG